MEFAKVWARKFFRLAAPSIEASGGVYDATALDPTSWTSDELYDLRRDGEAFFQRNFFTAGLELLVRRGFDRLAGKSEDGSFYLTQAMGGGKTHSLITFGLLAADPTLRRKIVPGLTAGDEFGAARVIIFSGHQNPETLVWGYIAEKLGRADVMAPF